jgi:putative NAD(P)-binding protein
VFALLLRPQIADHERQELVVRRSGLDWTLVQPVYLTDGDEPAALSGTGDTEGMRVSRRAVGGVLADLAETHDPCGRVVAVSGATARARGGALPGLAEAARETRRSPS